MSNDVVFVSADELPVIDEEILRRYYTLKKQLSVLLKEEDLLKERIKSAMLGSKQNKLSIEQMDFFCKTFERISYPKEKIEMFVPQEIKDLIRFKKEVVVLVTKEKNGVGKNG